MPTEPLEVFAAEITRLVLEPFPNYGECAIAMERFRRFVAGLDPVLQAKCHEHGATSLEDALAIACKWERAQEVLRLAPLPPLSQKNSLSPNLTTTLPSESLSAMVSTKTTASGDISSEIMTAVKQLTADVKALRMEVSQLKRQHTSSAQRDYSPERGRDKHHYSPLSSPRRYLLSPASSPHRRDESNSFIHREAHHRLIEIVTSAYHHLIEIVMSAHLHHIKIVTPASLHIMLLNMPALLLFVVTNVSARPRLTMIVMVIQPLIIKIRLLIIRIVIHQNGSPTSSLAGDLLLTICPHLVIIVSVLLMRMLIFRETAGSSEVSYLGHVVSSLGLLPDEKNLDKVRSWPTPRTVTEEVCQEFCCRCCTPSCFDLESECEEAFSPPIVAHPIFTHFFSGAPFKIIPDYKLLLNLKKAAVDNDPTSRRARWILEMDVYDFTILHREGKQHMLLVSGVLPDMTPTLSVDKAELQAQQKADFYFSTVMDWKESNQRPPLGRLKHSPATLSKLWHEFPKLSVQEGVLCRRVKSSPHSPPVYQVVLPECDGMVERLNRTLKDQLAKYICESGGEWDRYLPQVELAYNSSVHSSTGFSPFFLAHGREPRLPAEILLNCSPAVTSCTPGTPADYAYDVTTRLSYVFKDAAVRSTAAKLQKRQYDKKDVFSTHISQTLKPISTNARAESSNPTTLLSESDIMPSLSVPPVPSTAPDRAILPSAAAPQLTRSGRMVKKPERFKDIVC
ncbi:hypothetical protein M9458_050549 [Cirrhinus mrigala]|uniref:Integrase catalytic domain-containing protein n=1 Tax=Cirrhinus mrigala TaxID=683832 RepID=A0ABD0MX25_CIRMR